jgi:hypothetical protein
LLLVTSKQQLLSQLTNASSDWVRKYPLFLNKSKHVSISFFFKWLRLFEMRLSQPPPCCKILTRMETVSFVHANEIMDSIDTRIRKIKSFNKTNKQTNN